MFKKFMFMLLLIFLPKVSHAADLVQSIIVSAEAATKAEATKKAMETAVAQAYRVLSHAEGNGNGRKGSKAKNTLPGTIGKYSDCYAEQLSDRSAFVVLRAEINLSQLVAAMKSQGEAAPQVATLSSKATMRTFQELNSSNETEIIGEMFKHLERIGNLFDYKLVMGTKIVHNEDREYLREGTVFLYTNSNTNRFARMYNSVLLLLSMTKAERKIDKKLGRYHFTIYTPSADKIILRNSYKEEDGNNRITNRMANLISKRARNYVIADNISRPSKLKITENGEEIYTRTKNKVGRIAGKVGLAVASAATVLATGGAGYGLTSLQGGPTKVVKMFDYKEDFSASDTHKVGEFNLIFTIPANKINAYTDFRVEPARR